MAADPDEWWHSLPHARRQQIHRWIEQAGADTHPHIPGQRELFRLTEEPSHEETNSRNNSHADQSHRHRRGGRRAGHRESYDPDRG